MSECKGLTDYHREASVCLECSENKLEVSKDSRFDGLKFVTFWIDAKKFGYVMIGDLATDLFRLRDSLHMTEEELVRFARCEISPGEAFTLYMDRSIPSEE